MGKSVNQVILLGRLTRDVEVKATSSGKSVASASIAVDKGQDQTAFFEVSAWEKVADVLGKYTKKGSKVLIQGRLDQQTWEKDGKKQSKVVVVAYDVTLLDAKDSSAPDSSSRDVVAPDNSIDKPLDLSEIPF